MDLENAEEIARGCLEEKERLIKMVSVNQTETTQQTVNDDGTKESDEAIKTTEEENLDVQKDTVTIVQEKSETTEIDKKIDTNAEKGELNVSVPNGKSIVSEVNEELTTYVVDEDVTEPETKKGKLEAEQDITAVESSAWQHPFPTEFYTEIETFDCDPGPLWHFDDPYFIELAQVGNPLEDVAYVRLKTEEEP